MSNDSDTPKVDPAKGNELLKRLFGSKVLPIVHEPAPGYRPQTAQQEDDQENEDLRMADLVKAPRKP